jgi:hypothetical protein
MEKKVDEVTDQKNTKEGDQMERIENLLKENLEMNQEIRFLVRQINTYVAWQRIFGWLKIFLILIPLIIGFIYLPPLFQGLYQQAISFMSGGACQ